MNIKRLFNPVLVMTLLIVVSCASKKEEGHEHGHAHGDHNDNVWQEMDDFHLIMAETFHPYKDSTNLEPAKSRASELVAAADKWASSKLPEKVDNDRVKEKLRLLKSEAATLAESVRSSDENVIGERLTRVHDIFHEIQEAWYGGH